MTKNEYSELNKNTFNSFFEFTDEIDQFLNLLSEKITNSFNKD